MASVPAGAAFDLREHASASSARCTRREIAKVTELVRTLKVGECRFGRTCDVVLSEPASRTTLDAHVALLLHGNWKATAPPEQRSLWDRRVQLPTTRKTTHG